MAFGYLVVETGCLTDEKDPSVDTAMGVPRKRSRNGHETYKDRSNLISYRGNASPVLKQGLAQNMLSISVC